MKQHVTALFNGSTLQLDAPLVLAPNSRLTLSLEPPPADDRLDSERLLERMVGNVTVSSLYTDARAVPQAANPVASEHLAVAYQWIGRGWTQEIKWLRFGAELQPQWSGRLFTEFLDEMALDGFELLASTPLSAGESAAYGCVAYFRLERS